MKSTRITVAAVVAICATIPLKGLAHLSPYVYQLDFFNDAMRRTDVKFPAVSAILLPFGPLAWWSYITPVALAIAVAASLRSPIRPIYQIVMVSAAVIQALVMIAVALPYFILTSVMGNFLPHYPPVPLAANIALVTLSVGLAVYSVRRMRDHYGHRADSAQE